MKLGHELVEVAQRGDGSRARLDLVEEHEVTAGDDLDAQDRLKPPKDYGRAYVFAEGCVSVPPQLKVDLVYASSEGRAAEVENAVGLADVTGAAHHERLSPRGIPPFHELLVHESSHMPRIIALRK